jgi:hypothetical protein
MNLEIKKQFKDIIPPLTDAEFQQLESNILAEGIREAICTWNNVIIDGHNRYAIAQQHGLEFRVKEYDFADEFDVTDWIVCNQLGRRNLTELQKSHLRGVRYENEKQKHATNQHTKVAGGQNDHQQKTSEKLADEYGISPKTIRRDAEFAKGIEHLSDDLKQDVLQGKGKVNKGYIETLAKAEPTFTATTPEEVLKEARRIKEQRNKQRIEEKEQERQRLAEIGKTKSIEIDFRHGDFEQVFSDIKDASIDCIITDPPYPYEFIEQWTKLARFAKRVLKPNAYCIAYSGQMYLPEVIQRMAEHLDYYWTFAVYHEGQTQIVNGVNLICRWKPVLIFQNGKKKITNTIQDYFISEHREKTGHDWQQSKSGVSYLVEMFTNPNDLVCDPFAGSGTTLAVCKAMSRQVIGAEIDLTTYNIAKAVL